MLMIRKEIIASIRSAKAPQDLYDHLQGAIELEHSTIPPYLQALYSIKRGSNVIVANLIRSIVVEEMLHMTIAANILNAIGGTPVTNTSKFIPGYPSALPMNVHEGLKVGLAPLSKPLIKDVFMEIERPEHPKNFPVRTAVDVESFATIGMFYAAIKDKLKELGDGIFTGKDNRQVVDNNWFPADELFAIRDVATAARGIDIIVEQGEGTDDDPLEVDGQPAHYYRFAEIFFGRRLVPDATVPEKYSYSGAPIPFDPAGIWDMLVDPKIAQYAANSTALAYAERFNGVYTNLLQSLHLVFNGEPKRLTTAIGGMYELRLAADAMIEIKDTASGKQAAPTFEFALESV